jgi:hypothetical protein
MDREKATRIFDVLEKASKEGDKDFIRECLGAICDGATENESMKDLSDALWKVHQTGDLFSD